MNEDAAFLGALLAAPEDTAIRKAYLDWLEEQADPRAEFLRIDTGFDRIEFLDWQERQYNPFSDSWGSDDIEDYLSIFPQLREKMNRRETIRSLRAQLEGLGARLDSGWVAFMNSLGQIFRPFHFFDNTSLSVFHESLNPRERQELLDSVGSVDELPFSVRTGTRGSVVTFEDCFRSKSSWDADLMPDLRLLASLPLGDCEYGAASCPVHPFLCEIERGTLPITARAVLTALKVRGFRSEHIKNLDATSLPFPGYQPYTENDEIHNDFYGQHIFSRGDEEGPEPEPGVRFLRDMPAGYRVDMAASHELLKDYVQEQRLWYVLLHAPPELQDGVHLCGYVVLLAVGVSPNSKRLLGVVTHQVCHNLCD